MSSPGIVLRLERDAWSMVEGRMTEGNQRVSTPPPLPPPSLAWLTFLPMSRVWAFPTGKVVGTFLRKSFTACCATKLSEKNAFIEGGGLLEVKMALGLARNFLRREYEANEEEPKGFL